MIVVLLAGLALALLAPPAAPDPIGGTFAVVGARVHPISAPVIDPGIILVRDGTIVSVGPWTGVLEDLGAEGGAAFDTVDARGLDLWPGMIDTRSRLGLVEIGSVRGTKDYEESGRLNAAVHAATAINPSSDLIPVTRANGILLAGSVPETGLVAGMAAAVALDGWTSEEMVRRREAGLVVTWPDMRARVPSDETDARTAWEESVQELTEMIEEARAYVAARARDPEREADVTWEALRGVVSGEVPVWIVAGSLAEIRAALDWTEEHGLRMVLVAETMGSPRLASDTWRCAPELAARDVPVVLRTNLRPKRRYEPYDAPFTAPALLHAAGVRVAFGTGNAANARNLPQEAARAAAWGLPREIAERGLTLTAAEILGIADRYGSIEPGKRATFILVDGDLLETRMQVRRAWLDGRPVDLESRHTRLWARYRDRSARSVGPD